MRRSRVLLDPAESAQRAVHAAAVQTGSEYICSDSVSKRPLAIVPPAAGRTARSSAVRDIGSVPPTFRR